MYGVSLSGVSAEIPDLEADEEILTVAGGAAGPTADFLRFVATSPVSEKIDRFTEGMQAEGQGKLALKLTLPLRRLEQSKIDGDYQFLRNALVVDRTCRNSPKWAGGSTSMRTASPSRRYAASCWAHR
ncbi:MAG: DUF3971 domain-containing protein [Rhodocyclaceae bacterium]|nr:DUF3971 domain-containing protein [Rhodocyclaceae bacterium]